MATTQGPTILRQIRKLVAAQCPSQQSDMQLLQQFITDRDEGAFATLVERHGSMVLAVCKTVLHHQQDAEDAFQAAFLVLARKAHTIRKQQAVSNWLHGVAYRLALKVRSRRVNVAELAKVSNATTYAVDDLTVRELRVILHEELNRLGDKYRTPLLLCYWEGKTRDEAAEQLGMSAGAFKKCLERARNLLGSRLVRRGLVPSAAFFATLFSASGVKAAVPSVLVNNTAHAAVAFVTGASAAGSATSVALAEGVIRTMNLTKWAYAVASILLVAGLTVGLGIGGYQLVHANSSDHAISGGQAELVKAKGKKPADKTDAERIVGTWKFTEGKSQGQDLPGEFIVLGRLTFTKEGEMTMTIVEEAKKGKFNIVGPGKIDLGPGMNDKDVAVAIYKFDGNDRLTICATQAGMIRPTEFIATKESGQILFVLVRAKPGEEKVAKDDVAKNQPAVDKIREAAARQQSQNNLKQIGLAFHNFHDTYKTLPAHAIYSKDGKTALLSWRVAILPYIDHGDLYKQFKLDEAWDSDHNKKLIPKMPKIYVMPLGKAKDGETYYQVVTGPDTVFDGAKKLKFAQITDGTSNTLLALEAKDPVVWTKPADLTLPKDKDTKVPTGEVFSNGFNVLFCDGSVRFMSKTVSAETMRAVITPAGGEVIPQD